MAVIDHGFDLDPVTGLGNRDYNNNHLVPPLQIDVSEEDGLAGEPLDTGLDDSVWRGQKTFGACCAFPRNRFGGAGSGGEYVRL